MKNIFANILLTCCFVTLSACNCKKTEKVTTVETTQEGVKKHETETITVEQKQKTFADKAADGVNKLVDKTKEVAHNATDKAKELANNAKIVTKEAIISAVDKTKDATGKAVNATRKAASRAADRVSDALNPDDETK